MVDNVEQSEELANQLQFLVGKSYFDDESGHHYDVELVMYDEEHSHILTICPLSTYPIRPILLNVC